MTDLRRTCEEIIQAYQLHNRNNISISSNDRANLNEKKKKIKTIWTNYTILHKNKNVKRKTRGSKNQIQVYRITLFNLTRHSPPVNFIQM